MLCELAGEKAPGLSHPRVTRALDALMRDKNFVCRTTSAIPISVLKKVVSALPISPEGRAVKATVLLMFHAALRQSETLPPTMVRWAVTNHPTHGDMAISGDQLTLNIKWAKNMQGYKQSKLTVW